jgi:hypothetical protein
MGGDPELEKFKTVIDLRIYAAQQGYELDKKDSWAGSAVMRHANDDKIVIKRDADGHWVYFSVRSPDGSDSGTIIDFVKQRLGLSLGAVRKELRAFIGLPESALPTYPPLPKVAKDRIRVERAFARTRIAHEHPYLEIERAIPSVLLRSSRFAGRIRIDGRGNAIFPHFDADGLSGFEIKNHGFTGFSTGGTKGLWTSHYEDGDNRIVFAESAIDALSHAAVAPCPQDQTRYASISGKPNPKQYELIQSHVAKMRPASAVIAAFDADDGGQELVEILRTAVALTGRSDLRFEIQTPEGGLKDFNDVLRQRRGVVSDHVPKQSLG